MFMYIGLKVYSTTLHDSFGRKIYSSLDLQISQQSHSLYLKFISPNRGIIAQKDQNRKKHNF